MISEMVYPELQSTYKLGNPNTKFSIWRSKIDFVLYDLGVNYVLNDPKPTSPTDSSPKEDQNRYKKWVHDDITCRHTLLGAMEDNLFYMYDRYKTAKDMMDGITKIFKNTSLGYRLILWGKFKEHKMSEETPVMDHVLNMGVMARDLEEAGMKIPEEMQVVILMESLPGSWGAALSRFMHKSDLSLDRLIGVLKVEGEWRAWRSREEQEEEEKEQQSVGRKRGSRGNCFSCGKRGHYQNDCPD